MWYLFITVWLMRWRFSINTTNAIKITEQLYLYSLNNPKLFQQQTIGLIWKQICRLAESSGGRRSFNGYSVKTTCSELILLMVPFITSQICQRSRLHHTERRLNGTNTNYQKSRAWFSFAELLHSGRNISAHRERRFTYPFTTVPLETQAVTISMLGNIIRLRTRGAWI